MIKIMGVIGAGQMGSGIAQVAAQSGFDVRLVDVSAEQLTQAKSRMHKSLERMNAKAQLSESMEQVLGRVHLSTQMQDLADVHLCIEAASENVDLKLKIFKQLDGLVNQSAILASNTSSISITRLASATSRPEKVIGMHFMNPVPVMKLIEVISGLRTSSETLETVLECAKSLGKITTQSKDYAGFIANRILMPMINEAFFALMEGVASAEDIDQTLKLGAHHPMGPLTLADFIGLDTCLAIMQVLHQDLGDDKYRPCPLLRQYVAAGLLGKKSGRGVYTYEGSM